MGNDLPDYQSQWVSASVEATSFRSGLDADKPASPAAGDIWLARDTYFLYVCNVAGAWEKVTKLYLPLAGGTMSGAIAMGTNKITGMGDPSDNQDAATKAYADTKSGVFTELAGGQNKQVSAINTWEDWDISAIVPAGTKSVLVGLGNSHNLTAFAMGARKNGSALARYAYVNPSYNDTNTRWTLTLVTECDSNRIIEIYGYTVYSWFNILGYWT